MLMILDLNFEIMSNATLSLTFLFRATRVLEEFFRQVLKCLAASPIPIVIIFYF